MRTLLKIILFLFLVIWVLPLVLAPVFVLLGAALPNLFRSHQAFNTMWPVMGLPEIGILFVVALFVVAFAALILRVVFRGSNGRYKEAPADETRMMQEIYRSLSQMEKRIEALETILLDRVRRNRQ